MSISASDVKKLRDMTGAGMMDAKEALKECNSDFDEAVKYLREKGLADSKKRCKSRNYWRLHTLPTR